MKKICLLSIFAVFVFGNCVFATQVNSNKSIIVAPLEEVMVHRTPRPNYRPMIQNPPQTSQNGEILPEPPHHQISYVGSRVVRIYRSKKTVQRICNNPYATEVRFDGYNYFCRMY